MSYETIRFAVEDGVARLTLNRPDRLNSFNALMHDEVAEALTAAEQPEVRVLLLTGAGRGFCAGQDLADRAVAPAARRSISARRSSVTMRRWSGGWRRWPSRWCARSTGSPPAPARTSRWRATSSSPRAARGSSSPSPISG